MRVLLHPLPFDASVWPDEVRLLDESIAPTLYDFGEDIRGWARGVLDLAGPGPLDLVGNSVGGSCALEVAALAPDRVRSLVLIGAKAGHRPDPEFRDEALRVLGEDGLDAAFDKYWAPLFAPGTDPSVIDRGRAFAHAAGVAAVRRGVAAFHSRPDRHDFALGLDVPVLVIAGEHDVGAARTLGLGGELRHGTYRQLDGCGHFAPLEQPSQLANLLKGFATMAVP
ncbi:MAG: alpha/beta hydrolase [Acidimicrobiales bacterium]|nr:alpha/beta hydrolase [Acidimicrobiales bacterium]